MAPFDMVSLVSLAARAVNTTSEATEAPFQVICAWPVSGQYGPGSRILYYVLVAICVLARRAEWLRNACLAAALLIPLVAALHGIVLAVIHTDEAVDMDIYGAFQLCAVGVLVAPVAATLSRTYFKNPGRNAIVIWSLLVVAGLISLTVEFYRVSSQHHPCWHDEAGKPLNASLLFPYEHAQCGLQCQPDNPKSRIRGGSADNIYVVPIPYVLTFNVCIMLTAACCIPAILLVAWMMVTSSHTNWTRRFGEQALLTLKVPVKLFDGTQGVPTLDELSEHIDEHRKIGIVGTQSYRDRRQSMACPPISDVAQDQVEHHETAPSSSAASIDSTPGNAGIAGMLRDLHEHSALSVYGFELHGRPLQIREMKLAANVDNFARQVYAALRDLENENMDIIYVECIDVEENTPEARVMNWLRNEEKADRGSLRNKDSKERSRTPGAMILLALFSLAVGTILVIGERNLFSTPVNFQTEPMPNVGQWAPVAGTVLVVTGSIYVLIAEGMRKERQRKRAVGNKAHEEGSGVFDRTTRAFLRRLIKLNDFFDAPHWLFDHTEFQEGQKKYPLVPGETFRNLQLTETKNEYEPSRPSTESIRSAAPSRRSFTGSSASRQPETEPGTPDPDAPPARRRTLTLPKVESDAPSRRRRSTHNSDSGTPLESFVPGNSDHPTIIVDEPREDDDVIR